MGWMNDLRHAPKYDKICIIHSRLLRGENTQGIALDISSVRLVMTPGEKEAHFVQGTGALLSTEHREVSTNEVSINWVSLRTRTT